MWKWTWLTHPKSESGLFRSDFCGPPKPFCARSFAWINGSRRSARGRRGVEPVVLHLGMDVALVDQRVRRRRAGIGDEVQQAAQPAGGVGRRLGAQCLQRANEEGTVGHVVLVGASGKVCAPRSPGARRACPQRAAPTARRPRCRDGACRPSLEGATRPSGSKANNQAIWKAVQFIVVVWSAPQNTIWRLPEGWAGWNLNSRLPLRSAAQRHHFDTDPFADVL